MPRSNPEQVYREANLSGGRRGHRGSRTSRVRRSARCGSAWSGRSIGLDVRPPVMKVAAGSGRANDIIGDSHPRCASNSSFVTSKSGASTLAMARRRTRAGAPAVWHRECWASAETVSADVDRYSFSLSTRPALSEWPRCAQSFCCSGVIGVGVAPAGRDYCDRDSRERLTRLGPEGPSHECRTADAERLARWRDRNRP